MMNAANAVDTGLITFAARDSEFGGHKMKEGDILGLETVNLKSLTKILCMQLLVWHRSMSKRELPLLPLFTVTMYLKRKQRDAFQRIKSKVGNEIEVTLVNGGPAYLLLHSLD